MFLIINVGWKKAPLKDMLLSVYNSASRYLLLILKQVVIMLLLLFAATAEQNEPNKRHSALFQTKRPNRKQVLIGAWRRQAALCFN